MRTHYIRHIRGHVEVYDSDDNFIVSGDSETEVWQNLIEILIAKERAALTA